jgi:hypothetical protein
LNIKERYDLIIAAQKYSEHECHDIAGLLCIIRDAGDYGDNDKVEAAEKVLNIFILKKKLGEPVVLKKLRQEHNLW